MREGFGRFWNATAGYCYDVIDGLMGHDDALRPNQIFAVSLAESPLPPERQRQVVDACARHLLTSFGLRSLAPGHPQYHGGGFAFGRAGTPVTVLQSGPVVLPALDEDIRAGLVDLAPGAGLTLRTNAKVTRIAPDHTVEAEIEERLERFPADVVLVATGRPPNTAGLGLETAGVVLERGAVQVNEYRQSSSAPNVYAAGDVTGSHQHTPAAWYEGRLATENALLGNRRPVDFSLFPTATFTIPAAAQVGLSEAAARLQGVTVGVTRTPFEDSTAAAVRSETEGFVKVVFDQTSGRILGVHVLGAGAEDLIHVAAVAMRGGLTRDVLAGMHYVFPTLAGSVFDAMWD